MHAVRKRTQAKLDEYGRELRIVFRSTIGTYRNSGKIVMKRTSRVRTSSVFTCYAKANRGLRTSLSYAKFRQRVTLLSHRTNVNPDT